MNNETIVKTGNIAVAIATAVTEVALIAGMIWSFATAKPAILSVVLLLLSIGFGVIVGFDVKKYFFSKK